jgi:hypothetical protein
MNRALSIALAASAVVLIGPGMYVFSRAHALDATLARISAGETPQQVITALGEPQQERQLAPPQEANLEYRYTIWPMSKAWVVRFRDGRVVEKFRQ